MVGIRPVAVVAMLAAVGVLSSASSASPSSQAPDGPGALSHFDLARKDCVGTARNTTSKVWFTVANGELSDVYYPTVDNTNVETLQYVVTDGSTFTDLQSRDMTYTVSAIPGSGGMGCEVTATAKSGMYQLVTDYVTDPARNALVMQVQFKPKSKNPALQLYARFDPTVNGNGGGGPGNGGADSATVDTSTGHPGAYSVGPRDRDERGESRLRAARLCRARRLVLAGDERFRRQAQRRARAAGRFALPTTSYSDAIDGNVVQTGRVAVSPNGGTVLALGFGASQAEAVGAAEDSRGAPFAKTLADYRKGWRDYDASLNDPRTQKLPGISPSDRSRLDDEYYLSANVIKASEDKTFPGAIVAGLASPWGQAVSAGDPTNTYFGSYREVFARDLYEAWTGLLADGDPQTARDAMHFLFDLQQLPDGSMPRNSLINGMVAPDSFGTQLDECSYPILMANQMGMTDADSTPTT